MRNEAAFWNKVRGTLHEPALGRVARKLTDAFTAGTPDAFYVIDGITGFLELKFLPAWPKRADTLVTIGSGVTAEQRRYLEMLESARAPAHVLFGVHEGRTQAMFLLTCSQLRGIYDVALGSSQPGKVPREWLTELPQQVRPTYGSLVEALRGLRQG